MRRRFRSLCFHLLLMSMLFAFETKADISVPVWGQIIQNNWYLNIEIEDSRVTLHQRIKLKLRKLVSDDYIYTFTNVSKNGEFNKGSLSTITPPSGLKDSIFEHGCRLQYFSDVALEETLEVAFEYEYQYRNQNIGEIWYIRRMGLHWSGKGRSDSIALAEISCNQKIEVEDRTYPDGKTIGEGTHIVYYPSSLGTYLHLKICLPTQGKTDTLEERITFEPIIEHRSYISDLIKYEFITIEFTERNEGVYDYYLCGIIELDVEVAGLFAPFYAWFPNDHTDAVVKLERKYEPNLRDKTEVLEVEPSIMDEQKGFYFLIPRLSNFPWPAPPEWRCKKATLTIEIYGVQSENNCDFILVTAPQESSSVKFKIPEKFSFGHCFSPFEHDTTYQDEECKVKEFYGKCPSTGIAHVEWDTSASPENVSLFQK